MWNMEKDWSRLGPAVVAAYQAIGMRHTEFARAAGVSPSTLHRLERGTGGAPSASTLSRVERTLGWPTGSARQIADGGDPPPSGSPRRVAVSRPAALADPSVLDQLPMQNTNELQQPGEVLGVEVLDLGPDRSGTRMIVVVKRDPDAADPDPQVLRETMAAWTRKQRELRQQSDAPPNT